MPHWIDPEDYEAARLRVKRKRTPIRNGEPTLAEISVRLEQQTDRC